MKHAYQLLIGTALAVSIASCKHKEQNRLVPEEVIPVKVTAIEQQTLRQPVFTSGQFTTDDESDLSFKNGGIVHQIYVKEGDAVTKGQLLATLDLTDINTVSQQASINLQKAQRDYERALHLYRDSVSTREQLENAKTALDIAREQSVNANYNRSTAELRATRSGYVLQKFINEGEYVKSGVTVLQINGAANNNWVLKAGVSDSQWKSLSVGDKATITTDVMPGVELPAVVTKKPEGIDPLSGTFVVKLSLQAAEKGGIAAGLFGKAKIVPSGSVHAWTVPIEAILDGDKGEGFVFVTNDRKQARKIKVGIQGIANDKVLINKGLENEQYLITSGNAYLNNGSKIRAIQ